MGWAPGEQERMLLWQQQQVSRTVNRARLELLMMPTDLLGPARLYEDWEPVISFYEQFKQPPEEDVPDSKVIKNHNIW